MRVTTKNRIIEYLKFRGGLVSGSKLESCADQWQTKSSVISRRARELANEGIIERELSARRTVQYRYNTSRPLNTQESNQLLREMSGNGL